MATLSVTVKRYIVHALACFETPTEVSKAVKEEFDLEISRMQVQKYDPTKVVGQEMSKELRALFYATREKFKNEIETIPIANQAFRLKAMDKIYQSNPRNPMIQLQVMEQTAKEVGGAFTNTRRLAGVPGQPLEVAPAGLDHFYGSLPKPDPAPASG